MKKVSRLIFLMLLSLVVLTGCASGDGDGAEDVVYQYYTADELKASIENNDSIFILDIQVEEEFNEHHILGAVPTYAYPVKTDEERAKLDKVIPDIEASNDPVIIVCPGGAGGAYRTVDYLVSQGLDESRLYILENGQSKWPYDELLEQ